MSLRDKINQNPAMAGVVSLAIVIIAIVVIFFSFHNSNAGKQQFLPTKAFYSDDDGQTTYIDDITNLPPYQHNGKEAYFAKVYRTRDGTKFVAYLEKFDERDKKRIKDEMDKGVPETQAMNGIDVSVKKPGAGNKWVKVPGGSMLEIIRAMKIVPPGGKEGDDIYPVRVTSADMK